MVAQKGVIGLSPAEKRIVKALLGKGWRNQDIQALINSGGRAATINSGRITAVKQDDKIVVAPDAASSFAMAAHLTLRENRKRPTLPAKFLRDCCELRRRSDALTFTSITPTLRRVANRNFGNIVASYSGLWFTVPIEAVMADKSQPLHIRLPQRAAVPS